MKNIAKFCVFTIFLSIGAGYGMEKAEATGVDSYRNMGYICTAQPQWTSHSWQGYECVKTTYTTSAPTYDAIKHNYRTLEGTSQTTQIAHTDVQSASKRIENDWPNEGASDGDTPFIYLQNPPEGNISVSLDSQLDTYYPLPAFNQENGWIVQSKDKKISLNGEQKDHLFYELEINKIALNRNGKNFSSKEELVDYLQNSDFLTKLGFSDTEKKNSLGYILPKIAEADNTNFYYLSILSDDAIAEISTLTVQPTPEQIVRQYFAVYFTDVPVKTMGDFQFLQNTRIHTDDFVVKETGEFLIKNSTHVFFE